MPLRLTLTDYVDDANWRWVLEDDNGAFLGDHNVALDTSENEYQGFRDVGTYLRYYDPIRDQKESIHEIGAWVGEHVFGSLRDRLDPGGMGAATLVEVVLPEEAEALMAYPFELACLESGRDFVDAGIRFSYRLEAQRPPQTSNRREALRILAVFSLPTQVSPLNLRRERYKLQKLVRQLRQIERKAVALRIIQYGATRDTLRDALEDGKGWDVVHLSGHGEQGMLLLEDESGRPAKINTDSLGDLLSLTAPRLQLVTLAACYSGAGTHAAVRRELGLDDVTRRDRQGDGEAPESMVERDPGPMPEAETTELPNLGLSLSNRLQCSVLAMRYPVGDIFATDLSYALYEKLLQRDCALPGALQLALRYAVKTSTSPIALSPFTPILIGAGADRVRFTAPQRGASGTGMRRGLLSDYDDAVGVREPERFVGRLQPMSRASRALAPESAKRGVLFYGMPGAGKTTCALELAFRHEEKRFDTSVWYRAPEEGSDISGALLSFLHEIESRVNEGKPGTNSVSLVTALDDPRKLGQRLRALLQARSVLIILDNAEALLTKSNQWRDKRWRPVIKAMLGHRGYSRLVITSRRVPDGMKEDDRVQAESIHALSLAESCLLARELPHLSALFEEGDEGRDLFRRTLRAVQGHPKLLEFANVLAEQPSDLTGAVENAEAETEDRADVLDAFFASEPDAPGGVRTQSHAGESQQTAQEFVAALKHWTETVASIASPTARLLFQFLCRVEPEDRVLDIIQINWKDVLERLGDGHAAAQSAVSEPDHGLPRALDVLVDLGLVDEQPFELDEGLRSAWRQQMLEAADEAGLHETDAEHLIDENLNQVLRAKTTYTIHPGVAEAMRSETPPEVLDAVDEEMGTYHVVNVIRSLEDETKGRGGAVVDHARRAAPYLMRREKWEEAAELLEKMVNRDQSPSTLAFATPLLRRIVEATEGTDVVGAISGVLARALHYAGRHDEAARQFENLIEEAANRGAYRQASVLANDYANLLIGRGRYDQALDVVDRMRAYTRKAGLGRWTQIVDEGMRLQILASQGEFDAVMEKVDALVNEMESLPEDRGEDESADPWNVREGVLDAGHTAALQAEAWEKALAYNLMIRESKADRGASALDMARTRFNDYSPLLRLGRIDEARELLKGYRSVLEEKGAHDQLGKVYTALADVEDKDGNASRAVDFEKTALAYKYRSASPRDCAISHHNLANYLSRSGHSVDVIRAHRLAAALFRSEMRSGGLGTTLRALAAMDAPDAHPSFDAVADIVEQIEGVRFRELYARLCNGQPDGDAALDTVWRLVDEVRSGLDDVKNRAEALEAATYDRLPPELADALRAGDTSAAEAAYEELSDEERLTVDQVLQERREQWSELAREAGIRVPESPSLDDVLQQFEPLLQAAVQAVTDESAREAIVPVLEAAQERDWMLVEPVRRVWEGERDADRLIDGLDAQDTALVWRLLELVEASDAEDGQ